MKISIAMATYNGADYILEQLQSFIDQTLLPDELIITDDCSTDKTEEVVNEFSRIAPFPVIFNRNEKNLGYCGNFNAALMKATGDLVFLSDQDDVWFPEKIQAMVNLANLNPDSLVFMNDAELTDKDLNSVGLTKLGQIKSAGFGFDAFVMGCCCAVRKELLEICMPIPDGYKSHDRWLVDFAEGLDAKYVESTVLQYYRRHGSNESQFIANRTSRVSQYHVYWELVKRVLKGGDEERDQFFLEQARIFLSGVERANRAVDSKYMKRLRDLLSESQEIVQQMERRWAIRQLGLLSRTLAIIQYWRSGGYGDSGVMKPLLRDLLG